MAYDVKEAEAYIRRRAAELGMDPDKVVRAARTEGLGRGVWQSNVHKNGMREPSYGPFQMLVGDGKNFPRGLGNKFMEDTGLDPRDPKNWKASVDYALNTVKREGWRQWYGPRNAGLPVDYGVNRHIPAKGLTINSAPAGADAVRSAAASEGRQTPVNGEAPPLPPPIDVDKAPVQTAGDPTLGDRLGTALFGDELAAKLKNMSAPATADSPAGPLNAGINLASKLFGSNDMRQWEMQEAHAPIQSRIPAAEAEQAQRMQGAQQLMAQLLAARQNKKKGLTINSGMPT